MKYPGVQKLIDVLKAVDNSEKSQMGFDMDYWYQDRHVTNHPCGSACCIGGWAQACLLKGQITGPDVYAPPMEALIKFCELPWTLQSEDADVLWDLTMPESIRMNLLTLEMAIRVLEIFRDTGEVKWAEVYDEMKGVEA